jgi:hypothetical protein
MPSSSKGHNPSGMTASPAVFRPGGTTRCATPAPPAAPTSCWAVEAVLTNVVMQISMQNPPLNHRELTL